MICESARRCLTEYRPEDVREQAFQRRMLQLLDASEPFSRSNFQPGHLTASAFVLSPAKDAVVLVFHRKLEIWIQPGGHIESGDISLAAAARRELEEEVGPSLDSQAPGTLFDIDVHRITAHKAEPAHEHFDVRFCFQATGLTLAASDEVADARWVELSKIDQLTADQSVLRAVRKLRAQAAKA